MKELNGVWWTINQNQVPGTLNITEENKITLTTYEKMNETNIINGFSKCEKITLINATLDRTDVYYKSEESGRYSEKEEIKYCTYTYIVEMAILGEDYTRTGDIWLESLQLKYTNLEKWIGWKTETPNIKNRKENVVVEFKKFPEKRVKLGKFDIVIRKPYLLREKEYDMQIYNEITIFVENIRNKYIQSVQEIIACIQFFLILCMGDNINVTKIEGIDFYHKNIELILGQGKSNYENRSRLKNIIKYDDIKDNLETILKNWLKMYEEEELLIANFINLQRREDPLISSYKNLTTAIDSLYLVITKQDKTNTPFAEMIKRLIKETNFILNLSEEEINIIANKTRSIRKYYTHSNKTEKQMVNSNISYISNLMSFLIEVIRARIMLEIGIDKTSLEQYYKTSESIKDLKIAITNNRDDNNTEDERIREGKKVVRPLTKKEKEEIAQLNAIMGTKYRESGYDLENTKSLIEAIVYITAEYMDHMDYWGKIEDLVENFDQSLEVFHPEKWFRKAKQGLTGNPLIDQVISNLSETSDNMFELATEAEEKCREVWTFLLRGNNEEAKTHFLGDVSKYTEDQLIEALETTIENIYDVEYCNVVPTDAQSFADEIKRYLENYAIQE